MIGRAPTAPSATTGGGSPPIQSITPELLEERMGGVTQLGHWSKAVPPPTANLPNRSHDAIMVLVDQQSANRPLVPDRSLRQPPRQVLTHKTRENRYRPCDDIVRFSERAHLFRMVYISRPQPGARNTPLIGWCRLPIPRRNGCELFNTRWPNVLLLILDRSVPCQIGRMALG